MALRMQAWATERARFSTPEEEVKPQCTHRFRDRDIRDGDLGADMVEFRLPGGILSEETRRCPQCQEPMGLGSLGFYTFLGGARWYKERDSLMLGGDPIVKHPLGGDTWIDGFRCHKCRLLLLSY